MAEEPAPRPPSGQGADESVPETRQDQGISRGRKIRLAALVLVLVAVAAFALLYKAKLRRDEQRRREAVAQAVANMRQAVAALAPVSPAAKYTDALALWQSLDGLDPGNVDGNRLAVALCYARAKAKEAADVFNTLDARQIAYELDKANRDRAYEALGSFPALAADAASPTIDADGVNYLRRCRILWSLGLTIAGPDASDRDRALLLCRWFALHVRPEKAASPPADPYSVVWRGYGAPVETAWAYAEVARQMGVCTQVVAEGRPDETGEVHYRVQVYPAGAKPFLVDPYQGVPVVDPASGALLSYAPTQKATQPEAADPLRTAVDPRACFPRFLVFDHLLSVLPGHPRAAVDFKNLPAGQAVQLWRPPLQIISYMATQRYAEDAARAYAALAMLQDVRTHKDARTLHLHGARSAAANLYEAVSSELEKRLPQTEVSETADVFREAVEAASFFQAANAFDGGNGQEAEKRLRDYLARYGDGKWRPLAAAMLAEALSDGGDKAGADALWRDLPDGRKDYGVLRASGRFPAVAAGAQPAALTPPPTEEGPAPKPDAGTPPALPPAPAKEGPP